jgi:hypothetical protein
LSCEYQALGLKGASNNFEFHGRIKAQSLDQFQFIFLFDEVKQN